MPATHYDFLVRAKAYSAAVEAEWAVADPWLLSQIKLLLIGDSGPPALDARIPSGADQADFATRRRQVVFAPPVL